MGSGVRATTNRPVLVCISTIKADKRDTFRRHIDEIKAPAVGGVKPEVHVSVRLLEPAGRQPRRDHLERASQIFVYVVDALGFPVTRWTSPVRFRSGHPPN